MADLARYQTLAVGFVGFAGVRDAALRSPGPSRRTDLERQKLTFALIDGDGCIQERVYVFKALIGLCHLQEHVDNGFPAVILNEAFDEVDLVHGRTVADTTVVWCGLFIRWLSILAYRFFGDDELW